MSASVETISASKPMINVVSPFNENDDDPNKMNKAGMMNDQQEEPKENGSRTNTIDVGDADDIDNINVDLASKSCPNLALINTSSSCSPEVSGRNKDNERRLQQWKDQHHEKINLSTQEGASVDNNTNTKPEVEIIRISIKCRERPEIVLLQPFASSPKACLFTLKEGSRYRLSFSFIVSNNSVTGLKYVNTLWKAGVRVDKSEVLLGSFSPKEQPYQYELEEDTAPSGMFVRGLYCARTKVVDAHQNCFLDIKYYFEIQKSWPSCG